MRSRQQILQEKISLINRLMGQSMISTDWAMKNILGFDSIADFRKAKIKNILNEIKF